MALTRRASATVRGMAGKRLRWAVGADFDRLPAAIRRVRPRDQRYAWLHHRSIQSRQPGRSDAHVGTAAVDHHVDVDVVADRYAAPAPHVGDRQPHPLESGDPPAQESRLLADGAHPTGELRIHRLRRRAAAVTPSGTILVSHAALTQGE